MSNSGSPSKSSPSPSHSAIESPHKAPPTVTPQLIHSSQVIVEQLSDTGPISVEWSQELLERYDSELSKLDDKEEALLHRLAAIQNLQLMWSTAGRQGQMEKSDKRIQISTNKVLLQDKKLMAKRRKLSGVMSALHNVVGMLEERETITDSQEYS